ncbi:HD-GYP domain-containing protein [Anaeromicrobium sediminis]|uniref:Uncharacterized protein n=1 Tax=Anaeromicrobium sediminis TaxID=1478221 RepID=A0A267MGF6_9FIRM|nr:HD domain-containing phosphohydrolase [Anaeromicrobium sediminis]PAB57873.1 hypothetical protein CCE28_17915 [Anaeromicrobium sediminis]
MKELPTRLKLYVIFISVLGLVSLYFSVNSITVDILPKVIFFIALGIIAESLAIKVNGTIAISVGFGIGLASMLIFQSNIVVIIGFLSMLLFIEKDKGKIYCILNTPLYKRIFNGSAYSISLLVATWIYIYINSFVSNVRIADFNIIGIIMAVTGYLIINVSIFTCLMSILENKPPTIFAKESLWVVFNLIAISPLGIFIAVVYNSYGMFGVILFFGPLLLARHSFQLYINMKHMYMETIKSLSNAMEAKDEYTNGHSYRVADYATSIAKCMGLNSSKVEKIRIAAILHDIGKIGIPDNILNKCGKLDYEEYIEIQKHPFIGCKILSEVDSLAEVARIVKHHHERYDGKGYPDGIGGDEIPIESYILAVADAFDAMTSDRPYRKAMDKLKALSIVEEESGTQFHPKVVEAFVKYSNNFKVENV